MVMEVIQRDKAAYDGGQRGRYGGVAGVGVMKLPVDHVPVNLGMEGGLELADGSGDVQSLVAGLDFIDGESLAGKPVFDGRDVLRRRSVLGGELRRCKPFVVIGRAGRVLLLDELAEGGF